jgi:hypothetical protein
MRVSSRIIGLSIALTLLLAAAGCEQLMGPNVQGPAPERQPDTVPPPNGDVIGRTPTEQPRPEPTLPPPLPPAPDRGPRAGDRDYVPPSAHVVTSGTGRHLNYHADRNGRIYVQEAGTGRLVFSGRIQAGEQFDINPADDRATIDGRTVLDRQLDEQAEYRVMFEPDAN